MQEGDLSYPEPVQKGSMLCFKRPEDSDTITLDTVCSGKDDGKEESTRPVQSDSMMDMPLRYMCSRILHFLEDGNPVASELSVDRSALIDSGDAYLVSGVGLDDQQNGGDPARTIDPCNKTMPEEMELSPGGADNLRLDKQSASEASEACKEAESVEQGKLEAEIAPLLMAMRDFNVGGIARTRKMSRRVREMFDTEAICIAEKLRKHLESTDEAARVKAQELKWFLVSLGNSRTTESALQKVEKLPSSKTSNSQEIASEVPESNESRLDSTVDNDSTDTKKQSHSVDTDSQKMQMLYKYFQDLYGDVKVKLDMNLKKLKDAAAKSTEAEVSVPTQAYINLLAASQVELKDQIEELERITELVQLKDDALDDKGGEEALNAAEAETEEVESGEEGDADVEDEEEEEKVDSSDAEEIVESLRHKTSARMGARRAKRLARAVAQYSHQHKKKKGAFKTEPIKAGQSICGEVTNTFTKVDILWQASTGNFSCFVYFPPN